MGTINRQSYSPQRLDAVASAIIRVANQVARQAEAMRTADVTSVSVGDAMLRRSYCHITRFAVAVERAMENSLDRPIPVPWDAISSK